MAKLNEMQMNFMLKKETTDSIFYIVTNVGKYKMAKNIVHGIY